MDVAIDFRFDHQHREAYHELVTGDSWEGELAGAGRSHAGVLATAVLLVLTSLATGHAATRKQGDDSGLWLGVVADASTVYRSLGGSGHAVAFTRPENAKYVTAVQLYAGRYGMPDPPVENFHIYLLDQNKKVLTGVPFPYGAIDRSDLRWYNLAIPPTEVPPQFFVAVSFNPQQTKGVYLGLDERIKPSHSFIGLPNYGFQKSNQGEWMIRVQMAKESGKGGLRGKSFAQP